MLATPVARSLPSWVGPLVLMLLFWLSVMRYVELPGLYMDAINPDYLAAQTLDDRIHNPHWRVPGPAISILGGLYYGVQNYYVGLAVYSVLGESVVSARIAHALFGALIVLMVYSLIRRATSSRMIALLAGAGLATDIAFVASFRTQNYIVLGGQMWLLASVLLLFASDHPRRGRWMLALSGLSLGLAAYGYFVHLFFAPALLALVLFWRKSDPIPIRLGLWGAGFAAGMIPYAVGYGWAVVSLGGFKPFVAWIQNAVTGLRPLGESSTYMEGLSDAVRDARLALTTGVDITVLGDPTTTDGMWRWLLVCLSAAAVCVVGLAVNWRQHLHGEQGYRWLAMLPISYVLVAGLIGDRLGRHHYFVLVAFVYILLALAINEGYRWASRRQERWHLIVARISISVLFAVLLMGNLVQQNRFFARLDATGGAGMFTNASTALAQSALAERERAVYLFPEWGFFMPFVFLTGNQVHYELELSEHSLGKHRGKRNEVRLAFWDAKDAERYRLSLADAGAQNLKLYTFTRRDGAPALHLWAGRLSPQ